MNSNEISRVGDRTLTKHTALMDAMDVDDPLYARLFARAPAYDLVFSCLSPRSLVRLGLTCRAAYLAVAEFKARAFNINRHLSRYFTDPIAFRSLQARTNTLVSGSDVLQFLDRIFYPESDLDLYTHPGHSFEVAQFLVETEGYAYDPRESAEKDWQRATKGDWDGTEPRGILPDRGSRHSYPMADIKAIWTFKKPGVHQDCLKVQIIETSSSPLETILGFHSTCVMNFISSDAAYSLYPIATFEDRSSFGMPPLRYAPKAVQKYVKRGWRFYFIPTPHEMAHPTRSPFLLEQARWVSDGRTWRLPLDQTGVKERPPLSPASAPLAFDPVLYNGWRLRLSRGLTECYKCHYYPLRTTLFRYNYTIPDEALVFTIRNWAHRQGMYSHDQVSKEDWVWFDADLPDFMATR